MGMNWKNFFYGGIFWVAAVLITCWLLGIDYDWRIMILTVISSVAAVLSEKWWPDNAR